MTEIPLKKLYSIFYSLLSPETIRKIATVKIIVPELYDEDGTLVRGGLMDPRMGVIEPGLVCETCGKTAGKCPGHFGYIELAKPVFNIIFIPLIKEVLSAVCFNCGRVKLTNEEIEKIKVRIEKLRKQKRWTKLFKFIKKYVYSRAKKRLTCPHCKYNNPKIEFRKPYFFYVEEGEIKRVMYPSEVRSIFEKIPDDDLPVLGFHPVYSRPEWMILTVLPVPPVTVRPSIILESGERAEDDLTHKLVDIVRINQRLKEAITTGALQMIIDYHYNLLQYHVATYINNNVAGLPKAMHRSGKPIKSIVERIIGKYGIIRYNLLGKRINYSARAVISPDPKIKMNEVGVPYEIAKVLTIPEKVTEYNIEWLKKLVLNGPDKYPGANYVRNPEGKRITITEENKETLASMLEPGWIVERHLLDGDIVIFGRYPSLHRISWQGHYVRVMDGKTFRLHPGVCNPYNADFDGDEMNIFVPQSEEARAEAELLLELSNHLVTPRYGEFIVGGVQEVITGIYLLTLDDTKIPINLAGQLIYMSGADENDIKRYEKFLERAKKEGRNYLTGKEIFSVFLPEDLFLKIKDVSIIDGELKSGIITSDLIKAGSGKLFLYIHNNYGKEVALKVMEKIFMLGIYYQYFYGISSGISDYDIPKEAKEEIQAIIRKTKEKIDELYEKYKRGELERVVGKDLRDVYIDLAQEEIANSITLMNSILRKYIRKDTGTYLMAATGARGKETDIVNILGSLGQQAFRGKLIEFGYRGRNFTIFERGYDHPIVKGWVISSYSKGLEPWEVLFHAIPGRDALMDMSIRTAKSGYLYRRLAHSLYELAVWDDLTVRDSTGRIIQFIYGSDGMFSQKTESGRIDLQFVLNETIKKENLKGQNKNNNTDGHRSSEKTKRRSRRSK
ncbi:MAG: DNA-directed RNA polymerase subunit A' [Nanopusillaceae archaeon]